MCGILERQLGVSWDIGSHAPSVETRFARHRFDRGSNFEVWSLHGAAWNDAGGTSRTYTTNAPIEWSGSMSRHLKIASECDACGATIYNPRDGTTVPSLPRWVFVCRDGIAYYDNDDNPVSCIDHIFVSFRRVNFTSVQREVIE